MHGSWPFWRLPVEFMKSLHWPFPQMPNTCYPSLCFLLVGFAQPCRQDPSCVPHHCPSPNTYDTRLYMPVSVLPARCSFILLFVEERFRNIKCRNFFFLRCPILLFSGNFHGFCRTSRRILIFLWLWCQFLTIGYHDI